MNEPAVDQTSTVARAVSLAEKNQADLTIVDEDFKDFKGTFLIFKVLL